MLAVAGASRDTALDIAKGVCVVSMTSAHLAEGTWLERLLHLPPYVDGASGFVLMSGLVLGMVQRQRVSRTGEGGAALALVRRARLVYLVHVALVVLALGLAHLSRATAWWLPRVEQEGGWALAASRVLLLQIVPPYMDVLGLYVVLFALGVGATALLVRGRVATLVFAMAGLYAASWVWPSATSLGSGRWDHESFDWGGWQLVFLSAFVAGWYWKQCDLARRVTSVRAMATAACCAALVAGCGVAGTSVLSTPWSEALVERAFAKDAAGPGRVAMAVLGVVLLYGLLVHLTRAVGDAWASPLERIGRRSLDSYVLLTLIMLVAVAGFDVRPVGARGLLLAGTALAVIVGWARLRDAVADGSATHGTQATSTSTGAPRSPRLGRVAGPSGAAGAVDRRAA